MAGYSVRETLRTHGERITALERMANRVITILERILVGVSIGIGVLVLDVAVRLAVGKSA